MKYIELVGGLILLVVSGDYLVKGGVGIAKRFKVSSLVVGMTVVAFGTSAPELIVSLEAALNDHSEIALGNVIGSNIANIGLILGLTALVLPICVNKISVLYDWPMMMTASLLFFVTALNGRINRIEGIIGFIILIVFVGWSIRKSKKEATDNETDRVTTPIWHSILYIVGSSAGLAYGARFLVSGASDIALSFGVSERIIGVTIVAFGTSVPELAASMAAAIKKEMDISIGNIIGSNIFNILCVIGLTSAIKPIPVDVTAFRSDLIWMLVFSLLLFIFMLPWRNNIKNRVLPFGSDKPAFLVNGTLGRISGGILVFLYIFYVYQLF